MITRKEELIAKLDQLIELEGWKESASDLAIPVVVSGLDKLSDKLPQSVQDAINALLGGIIDGEFDGGISAKDGGETPPDPDPDKKK